MKKMGLYEEGEIRWRLSKERQQYHYVEEYDAEYFFKYAKVISIAEALASGSELHDKWHKPQRTKQFLEGIIKQHWFKEGVVCAHLSEPKEIWYGTIYIVIEAGSDKEFKKYIGSTRMAPQEFNDHGKVLGNPVYRLWWD